MNSWLFCVVILFVSSTSGYKILFLSPINGQSNWLFSRSVIKALLNRHHEVTCITPITWPDPKPENYTEILALPPVDLRPILPRRKAFAAPSESVLTDLLLFTKVGKMMADHLLSNTDVQRFILRNDLSFDLVINEEFYMESLSMFAFKFNAPLITISSHGHFDFFDRQFGLLTPWSHVPHTLLDYSDEMTLFERLHNTVVSLTDWTIRRFIHIPNQMEIAEKHFGHLGKLPSINKLVTNVSVILVNMHRFFLPPRPSMPGIVYFGGAHIEQSKPLPDDMQTFIDEAKDGVIFFSFGTYPKSNEMPPERLKVFLDAFGQIKQRVLWEYDGESIENVPSNVLVRNGLPQTDILSLPNVVLFISNGGMLDDFESIHHGVPLLMIPFSGAQFGNAKRAERAGYAKQLHFNELDTNSLINTIWEMTTNKSYFEQAKYISEVFRDSSVPPMDDAVWWIEHVAKFHGAKHLKSHAVNMSWFSYLLLDVFCVIVLGSLSAVFIFYFIIKFVVRTCNEKKRQKRIKLY